MNIKQVNMHEAKEKLSELGKLAWKGDKIIIAKASKPYLDLHPHLNDRQSRKPGRFKGVIKISDDFDKASEKIIKMLESD